MKNLTEDQQLFHRLSIPKELIELKYEWETNKVESEGGLNTYQLKLRFWLPNNFPLGKIIRRLQGRAHIDPIVESGMRFYLKCVEYTHANNSLALCFKSQD